MIKYFGMDNAVYLFGVCCELDMHYEDLELSMYAPWFYSLEVDGMYFEIQFEFEGMAIFYDKKPTFFADYKNEVNQVLNYIADKVDPSVKIT